MSRTPHSKRPHGCGYDYGSRRLGNTGGCAGWGPEVKRITHRKERRESTRQAYAAKTGGTE